MRAMILVLMNPKMKLCQLVCSFVCSFYLLVISDGQIQIVMEI